MLQGLEPYAPRGTLCDIEGLLGGFVADELNTGHQAEAANVADDLELAQRLQLLLQVGA